MLLAVGSVYDSTTNDKERRTMTNKTNEAAFYLLKPIYRHKIDEIYETIEMLLAGGEDCDEDTGAFVQGQETYTLSDHARDLLQPCLDSLNFVAKQLGRCWPIEDEQPPAGVPQDVIDAYPPPCGACGNPAGDHAGKDHDFVSDEIDTKLGDGDTLFAYAPSPTGDICYLRHNDNGTTDVYGSTVEIRSQRVDFTQSGARFHLYRAVSRDEAIAWIDAEHRIRTWLPIGPVPSVKWVHSIDRKGLVGTNGHEVHQSWMQDQEQGTAMIIDRLANGEFDVWAATADSGDIDHVHIVLKASEAEKVANEFYIEHVSDIDNVCDMDDAKKYVEAHGYSDTSMLDVLFHATDTGVDDATIGLLTAWMQLKRNTTGGILS